MIELQPEMLEWLLGGDPGVRWQVQQDLLNAPPDLVSRERQQTTARGWGAGLLQRQDAHGTWGRGVYSLEWTSTTYTLLLRCIGEPPGQQQTLKGCQILLDQDLYADGGINFSPNYKHSDTCISGMVLSQPAYFRLPDERFHTLAAGGRLGTAAPIRGYAQLFPHHNFGAGRPLRL